MGIDKGWDYAPGASVAREVGQMAEKTLQWDYSLAKAYMQEAPNRDALAKAYRALPSVADDARRYAEAAMAGREVGPYRTMGLLTGADAGKVAELKGLDAAGYDYALDASAVGHIRRKHGDVAGEGSRGQRAVTAEDYAGLPGMLNDPDRVEDGGLSDVGQPVVRYVKEIGGEIYTAAFEARKGRRMLSLISMWIRQTP
ncbi:MAG: PBECR3 domain-containing polyvalent protein [Desulfobulbia bacterium]